MRHLTDRRGQPRFEIASQLWGNLETRQVLPLRNVSQNGVLVESGKALALDSVHVMCLTLQGEAGEVHVKVRHVTACDRSPGPRYLVGCEFVTVSSVMRQWIAQVVLSAQERIARPEL